LSFTVRLFINALLHDILGLLHFLFFRIFLLFLLFEVFSYLWKEWGTSEQLKGPSSTRSLVFIEKLSQRGIPFQLQILQKHFFRKIKPFLGESFYEIPLLLENKFHFFHFDQIFFYIFENFFLLFFLFMAPTMQCCSLEGSRKIRFRF
jgi:hypothetical protein